MRQVIRADLTLVPDPRRRPRRGRSRAARRSARTKPDLGESPGTASLCRRRAVPAWARASGRAGHGDPLFVAGASLALLDALSAPRSARRRRAAPRLALQSAAASAKILRLNADEGALRDLRFAVGDALGPAAKLLSCGASSPAARPASTPAGSPPPRPRSIFQWPTPKASRKACANSAGEGIRFQPPQRRPPRSSPPSRTPQRPKPKSSPFGRSTCVLAHPAALAAARCR